jgi:hypothetical protein
LGPPHDHVALLTCPRVRCSACAAAHVAVRAAEAEALEHARQWTAWSEAMAEKERLAKEKAAREEAERQAALGACACPPPSDPPSLWM